MIWKAACLLLTAFSAASLLGLAAERAERKEAERELFSLTLALNEARANALQAALTAAREARAEKDRRHDDIARAGAEAAARIAAAAPETDGVDIDAPLPLSLTDFRHRLHGQICAAGSCGFAGPGPLQTP